MRCIKLAILAALLPFGAQADKLSIGVGVGTLGPEISASLKLLNNFDAVAAYSSLDYDDTFSDDDQNEFTASARIEAPRIGIQYFPLSNFGFFLEGGMVFGSPEIDIAFQADDNAQFEVNDVMYNVADIGTLTGSASFDVESAPYLLAGFGRSVGGGLGLSISAGLISYGSMDVDIQNSQCTLGGNLLERTQLCGTLQANILAEESKVNSDLEGFELWPFLRVGLSYSF